MAEDSSARGNPRRRPSSKSEALSSSAEKEFRFESATWLKFKSGPHFGEAPWISMAEKPSAASS